ncbi:hypothetical protein B0H11DRAFT_2277460 [Mycena galericulata]|nr:hypothetical protein B0H11DRAFT_2277460 [Mycena galericulata]
MATLTDVQPVSADTVVTAPCISTLCSTPAAHLREETHGLRKCLTTSAVCCSVLDLCSEQEDHDPQCCLWHDRPAHGAIAGGVFQMVTCERNVLIFGGLASPLKNPRVGRLLCRTLERTHRSRRSQDPTETRQPQCVVAASPNVRHLIVLGYASTTCSIEGDVDMVGKYRSHPAWRWTLHVSEGLGSEPPAPAASNQYNRARRLRDDASAHGHPPPCGSSRSAPTVPPPPTPCVCEWAMTAGGVGNSTDHVGYDGYAGVSGTGDW